MRLQLPRTTLFGKILVWFAVTGAVTVAAFLLITGWLINSAPQRSPFSGRVTTLQLDEARWAYEEGGPDSLADHLRQFAQASPGTYYFLNKDGIDLVSGADRAELVKRSRDFGRMFGKRGPPPPRPDFRPTPQTFIRMLFSDPPPFRASTEDGLYHIIVQRQATIDPARALPLYLGALLVVLISCYVLAMHIARPVTRIREAVTRFGAGDLDARTDARRRDELGELAAAFNQTAERMQTLLAAERRLLQDVSHELRSPLARMSFAIELARTSADPEKAHDRIKTELTRLSTLVGELLQVTRVEGDPSSLSRNPVAIDGLVRSVVDDCAIEAEARSCRIDYSNGVHTVITGDAELLRRALENVVRNAIRHAPDQTAVAVSLEELAGQVCFTVRDHGTGVPEEMLSDIFRPFFRVEGDRNRTSGGTGLGLAIAERAIRAHGGEIRAENAHPGLRVVIALPLTAPKPMISGTLQNLALPEPAGAGLTNVGAPGRSPSIVSES